MTTNNEEPERVGITLGTPRAGKRRFPHLATPQDLEAINSQQKQDHLKVHNYRQASPGAAPALPEAPQLCGLCGGRLDDGRHQIHWEESGNNRIQFQFLDCPFYIGFNGRPVVFIPQTPEEELELAQLRADLRRREVIIEQALKDGTLDTLAGQ